MVHTGMMQAHLCLLWGTLTAKPCTLQAVWTQISSKVQPCFSQLAQQLLRCRVRTHQVHVKPGSLAKAEHAGPYQPQTERDFAGGCYQACMGLLLASGRISIVSIFVSRDGMCACLARQAPR